MKNELSIFLKIGGTIHILLNEAITLLKQNLLDKERSEQTIRGYITDLTMMNRFLSTRYNGLIYLENVTEDDIEAYLRMLREEKSYKSASF